MPSRRPGERRPGKGSKRGGVRLGHWLTVEQRSQHGDPLIDLTEFQLQRQIVLDANYTQNNQVGAPRGKHITNQFGGTLGAPLRKNKDFLFLSFEGFRERPAPNTTEITQNFVYANSTGKYAYNQPMLRWDHVLGDKDRVNALVTFQHGHEYRNQTGIPGAAAGGNIYSQRTNVNAIADWTHILSPVAMLDVRASFGRFTALFPDGETDSGITAQDLGMTNMIHAPTSTSNFPPRFTVDQFSDLFGNTTNLYTWGTDNQWNLAPSITITHGKQTIKLGLECHPSHLGVANLSRPLRRVSDTREPY
jgi:hypothetical protein